MDEVIPKAILLGVFAAFITIVSLIVYHKKTYDSKKTCYKAVAAMYYVSAVDLIIICILASDSIIELIQKIFVCDSYTIRVLKKWCSWILEKNILDFWALGFCMLTLSQYALGKHEENEEYTPIKQLFSVLIALCWTYLIFIVLAVIVDNKDNTFSCVSFFAFSGTVIAGLCQILIDKDVERSKSYRLTNKRKLSFMSNIWSPIKKFKWVKHHEPTDKTFLVDVCSNADIQCVHKSYTVRWHEHDS